MDKRFLGFLAIIAILFSGIFIFTKSNKATAPSDTASKVTNHVKGGGSSGVNLTEYGDFACPACARDYPLLKELYEQYRDQITFQFRHFPLFSIPGHENAIAAGRAAEAADKQNKFWEMHDLLYENQQSWIPASSPQAIFEGYAKQLNLDTAKFMVDFKSPEANGRVQADIREGTRLGVNSTPTYFIDGIKISNPNSLEAFSKVIDAAIEQKTGKKPAPQTTGESTSEAAPAEAGTGPSTSQ